MPTPGSPMSATISVIIPAYNAEKYLDECLDSVLGQTHENLEVLLIDDGSTDGTLQMAQHRAQNDARLKVTHTENHGQGHARNVGIRKATGNFVCFVDSDDTLEPTALESALGRILEDDSDFVIFFYKYFWDDREGYSFKRTEPYFGQRFLEGRDRFQALNSQAYYSVNRLYRRELLLDNDIFFEEGHIYEDNPFVLKTVICANRISLMHAPLYNVRVNSASSTRQDSGSDKHLRDYVLATRKCVDTLTHSSALGNIEDAYYYYTRYALRKYFEYYYKRIPRGHRHQFSQHLVDALSVLGDYPILNPRDRLLPVCRRLGVFDHRRGWILGALAFGKNRVLPHYRNSRRALREMFHRSSNPYDYDKPIQSDLVLFMGFDFRYTGNSRYLFEEMLRSDRTSALTLKFVTESDAVSPKHKLLPNSPEMFDALSRAAVVIHESWVKKPYRKRPGTTWIQLWHGSPIKRMLFDSTEQEIVAVKPKTKNRHYADICTWDYFLVDEARFVDVFRTAFLLDPSHMVVDRYPRVRYLVKNATNEKEIARIKAKYQINNESKVVLYCPTWRDYNYALDAGPTTGEADFSYLADTSRLQAALGENYQIIFKDSNCYRCSNSLVDILHGAELQELILIADVLVSDYSSVIFDAKAIGLPYVLFCNDFQRFQEGRGVYTTIWKSLEPNVVATEEELAERVLQKATEKRTHPLSLADVGTESSVTKIVADLTRAPTEG